MLRLRSSINLGFLVGALALVLVGGLSLLSSRRLRNEARWVSHTYVVIHMLDQLESDVRLPARDSFVNQRIVGELDQLRSLTSDNKIHNAGSTHCRRSSSRRAAAPSRSFSA